MVLKYWGKHTFQLFCFFCVCVCLQSKTYRSLSRDNSPLQTIFSEVFFASDSLSFSRRISRYPFILNRWQASCGIFLAHHFYTVKFIYVSPYGFLATITFVKCPWDSSNFFPAHGSAECLMLQLRIFVLKLFSSVPLWDLFGGCHHDEWCFPRLGVNTNHMNSFLVL